MSLYWSKNAEEDLDSIYLASEDVGADIELCIEAFSESKELLSAMFTIKNIRIYHPLPNVDIKPLQQYFCGNWEKRKKLNIYRLRILDYRDIDKYRIIYASNPSHQSIHILAIVEKNNTAFNYEQNDPIMKRIIGDYYDL